jgi:hypothetical protein
MKEELGDLQPMLKQKTREVQALLVTLEKDQKGHALIALQALRRGLDPML